METKKHNNFLVSDSGFVIDTNYPHLGASPGEIVSCDCCNGCGVLEIKCPFLFRSVSWQEELVKQVSWRKMHMGLLESSNLMLIITKFNTSPNAHLPHPIL